MAKEINIDAIVEDAKSLGDSMGGYGSVTVCYTDNAAVFFVTYEDGSTDQFTPLSTNLDDSRVCGDVVMDWMYKPSMPSSWFNADRKWFYEIMEHEKLLCFVSDAVLEMLRNNKHASSDELFKKVSEFNNKFSKEIAEKVKTITV